jgi:TonB family protein
VRISDRGRYVLVICVGVATFAGLGDRASYACATPNRPARVIKLAPIEWATAYGGLGAFSVNAIVTVDPKGNVMGVQLPTSSGDKGLDQAAMRAARQSTYVPQIKDCKPILGPLMVEFEWRPD